MRNIARPRFYAETLGVMFSRRQNRWGERACCARSGCASFPWLGPDWREPSLRQNDECPLSSLYLAIGRPSLIMLLIALVTGSPASITASDGHVSLIVQLREHFDQSPQRPYKKQPTQLLRCITCGEKGERFVRGDGVSDGGGVDGVCSAAVACCVCVKLYCRSVSGVDGRELSISAISSTGLRMI